MNRPRCTVGECRELATHRLEIRRAAGDELPGESRPVCSDPLCVSLARTSAAGFDRRLVALEGTEQARRVAKIRRGLARIDVREKLLETGPGAPPRFYETPAELDRAKVEAAGFPPGIDYEALILAEDEEHFGD